MFKSAIGRVIDGTPRYALSDGSGVVVSIGCAVHCAAMPLLIGYLPSLGLSWLAHEHFHQWMAILCVVIALGAFVPGWMKHRRIAPAILGILGIGLISSAAFAMESCCDPISSSSALKASSLPTTNLHVAPDEPVCNRCEACHSTGSANMKTPQLSHQRYIPCVTPLGGCVLVVAHLLNHCFGCRCCSRENTCESSSEEVSHGQ